MSTTCTILQEVWAKAEREYFWDQGDLIEWARNLLSLIPSHPALVHIPPYSPLYGGVYREGLATCCVSLSSPPPLTHKPQQEVWAKAEWEYFQGQNELTEWARAGGAFS